MEEEKKNEKAEENLNTQQSTEEHKDINDKEKTQEKKPEGDYIIDPKQHELDELNDRYKRVLAEFENYKKRTLKEKTELILNGSEKTITAILPVLDDFERANPRNVSRVFCVNLWIKLVCF